MPRTARRTPDANGDARPQPDHEVVIVGAGFSGMGAAIKLKRAGIDDLVILERKGDVGGTWRDNTYPGVAVDIPSFTYSYHFEQNPSWSRAFAPGAELQSYAMHVADKHDLRRHLRTNTDVKSAVFDETGHFWRLSLADGSEISGRFLFSCHGALVTPLEPDIPGLKNFKGHVIRTTKWDHDHDLNGKRVAVIGTGATALQVVPSIAPQVASLDVYQRTPIWVVPKVDPSLNGAVQTVFKRVPFAQRGVRAFSTSVSEVVLTLGGVYHEDLPFLTKAVEKVSLAHLRRQVPDPELRAKLTPSYGFGCKRPSFSNTYFKAFNRDNVELVTDGIDRITKDGIRAADGTERKIDTLILATGFKVFDVPYELTGTSGVTLNDFWDTSRRQAYHGTSVVGYPNMFLAPGPYGVAGVSWFTTIDLCVTHAVRAVTEARRRGATRVEISRAAHERFHALVTSRVKKTLFFDPTCAGSNSYYVDHHGDAPFLRPTSTLQAWLEQRRFALDDYEYAGMPGPESGAGVRSVTALVGR